MSLLQLLLNILWLLFGGIWMAAGWVIAGLIMALTIVGLPWTFAAFKIAAYSFLPFGNKAVSRREWTGQEDLGTGALGVLGNILWLVLAGWWLALAHLVTALMWAVTIIGLPFAWAHLKLAAIALWPIGKMIVPTDAVPQYGAGRR
ncbi:MAG: YccF domain-containing protein [Methylovirgula sp.]